MTRRLGVTLLVTLLLLPHHGWAAGPPAILDAGKVLRGRFVQDRHLGGFNAPLRSAGHFVLAPGRGLIWVTDEPFALTIVITAAGLVQETNGKETMHLSAARLPLLSRLYDTLSGALVGDWRRLEADFKIDRSGDAAAWRVVLTARTDRVDMPFRSIVASGRGFVDRIEITKSEGDLDELVFLDQALDSGPLAANEATAIEAASR